ENPTGMLALMVQIAALESGRDFFIAGSTTFKREDLAKGFEPDASFYFRNEAAMQGKTNIDLALDPPPELTIEVDISNCSLSRFPIYAAIGAEEVWRYDGDRVRFYRLDQGQYREVRESIALPPLTSTQASIWIERSQSEKVTAWTRSIQSWV